MRTPVPETLPRCETGTRLMLTIALGLLVALVVLATLVRLLEPRFAFIPTSGESVTPRDFGVDYDSVTVRTRDGERSCSWSLAGPAARARIVRAGSEE